MMGIPVVGLPPVEPKRGKGALVEGPSSEPLGEACELPRLPLCSASTRLDNACVLFFADCLTYELNLPM